MSPRSRTLSVLGSAALAGLLTTGLGACSDDSGGSDGAETEESTTEGSDAASEDVFEVAVGDCLSGEAPTGNVTEVPVVDCAQPHDSEVFFAYQIPGDQFPEGGAMDTITNEQCLPAFQDFVGMAYDQSALEMTTLAPTSDSWAQGDRELLCVVVDPNGNVTGSLQGANR